MRALLAALGLACAASVAAQQPASPNIVLNWANDDANEVQVPVAPNTEIRVTMSPREIAYTANTWKCDGRATFELVPKSRPPVVLVKALRPGTCKLTVETSRRRYLLWLNIKDTPVPPVTSITWRE